jgi:hypothetical protein
MNQKFFRVYRAKSVSFSIAGSSYIVDSYSNIKEFGSNGILVSAYLCSFCNGR